VDFQAVFLWHAGEPAWPAVEVFPDTCLGHLLAIMEIGVFNTFGIT
jgi:hypothetical protein